jgi:hypothetical protein
VLLAGAPPRLPSRDAEFRLLDPAGRAGHARRFLPDAAYGGEAATRLVRSAGQAAFAVISPTRGR